MGECSLFVMVGGVEGCSLRSVLRRTVGTVGKVENVSFTTEIVRSYSI